ncbi:MAG: hypothetical protein ACOYNS_09755, partial [Bacteroidota bacterium]
MKQLSTTAAAVLFILFYTVQSFASTATPYPVTYQQPDGTTISIRLKGDEHLKWAVTPDGFTILLNSSGFYEYASLSQDGSMVLSGIRAHDISLRTTEENILLQSTPKGLMFSPSQVKESYTRRARTLKTTGATAFPTTGNRKLLLIL